MNKPSVLISLAAEAKRAKKKIREMGRELQQNLDGNFTSEIDIEDYKRIERTKKRLDQLSKNRQIKINPKVDKFKAKKAKAEINSIHKSNIRTNRFEFDDRMGAWRDKAQSNDIVSNDFVQKQMKKQFSPRGIVRGRTGRDVRGSSGRHGTTVQDTNSGFQATSRDLELRTSPNKGLDAQTGEIRESSSQIKRNFREVGETQKPTGFQKSIRDIKKQSKEFRDNFDVSEHHMGRLKEHGKTFTSNFKKYSPNIMMWWKLVALLLPMMIALRVQALGVKTALQAIGAAGVGMVGLGLIGHGEAIEDSMALMERRINELRRELFQQFSPVFQEFAPISERFLGTLSSRLQPLVDTLRQLTLFEGAVFRTFDDLVRHVNNLLNWGIEWVDEFEQVGRRFLDIGFERLQRFLEFLFTTMTREQDAIIGMIDSFTSVINVVWNLLLVVSQVISILSPLLNLISRIASLITGHWIGALASTVTAFYAWIVALNTLITVKKTLMGLSLVEYFHKTIAAINLTNLSITILIERLRQATWQAIAMWSAISLGAGLALYAGTSIASNALRPDTEDFGTGNNRQTHTHSPTYNTQINVQGEMSNRQLRQIEDVADRRIGQNSEIEEDMSP